MADDDEYIGAPSKHMNDGIAYYDYASQVTEHRMQRDGLEISIHGKFNVVTVDSTTATLPPVTASAASSDPITRTGEASTGSRRAQMFPKFVVVSDSNNNRI
eukprot:GHVU01181493.1.p2 GENE.GHVU01181493.1~~GHVU01181493.1.p2  ORF type:complete len:102 (-),score=11.46 GHVU01181493.1:684-989(-)